MNLIPAEKETIILTSEADETASIYTFDARLKAKLKQLHERFPDRIYPDKEVKHGAVSYIVPEKLHSHIPAANRRTKSSSKRTCKDNGISTQNDG